MPSDPSRSRHRHPPEVPERCYLAKAMLAARLQVERSTCPACLTRDELVPSLSSLAFPLLEDWRSLTDSLTDRPQWTITRARGQGDRANDLGRMLLADKMFAPLTMRGARATPGGESGASTAPAKPAPDPGPPGRAPSGVSARQRARLHTGRAARLPEPSRRRPASAPGRRYRSRYASRRWATRTTVTTSRSPSMV